MNSLCLSSVLSIQDIQSGFKIRSQSHVTIFETRSNGILYNFRVHTNQWTNYSVTMFWLKPFQAMICSISGSLKKCYILRPKWCFQGVYNKRFWHENQRKLPLKNYLDIVMVFNNLKSLKITFFNHFFLINVTLNSESWYLTNIFF